MQSGDVTGIVLAGGKSSRMGTDKSLLVWRGKTLIEHAIDKLRPLCRNIVISSNNQAYQFTGCRICADELPQQAPIIGIYSCLKHSATGKNLVLSCDMPFTKTGLLQYLLDHSSKSPVVVPIHDTDLIEPLCGVYDISIIPAMEQYIRNDNLSLYKFINNLQSLQLKIGPELPFYRENMFFNVNTPDDLNTLLIYND